MKVQATAERDEPRDGVSAGLVAGLAGVALVLVLLARQGLRRRRAI